MEFGPANLSWSQFCKEPLAERNFTFWEWFYAVMKLTREHLRGPWFDGAIIGFVRKRQAEEMLAACPNGTFLLRFSDSELGGVTIAWVGMGASGECQVVSLESCFKFPAVVFYFIFSSALFTDQSDVFMLQPFTSKDFAIRSLADRILDLSHLVYLYPDIKKDIAFSKYYTPFSGMSSSTRTYGILFVYQRLFMPVLIIYKIVLNLVNDNFSIAENQQSLHNGYVKPLLVTHVPGFPSLNSNPGTPHMYPQSPDTRDTPSVAGSVNR